MNSWSNVELAAEFMRRVTHENGRVLSRRFMPGWMKKNMGDILPEIISRTAFLDDDFTSRERVFFLQNNITSPQLCATCGNMVHPKSYGGWTDTKLTDVCSALCWQKHPHKSELLKKAFIGRDEEGAKVKRESTMIERYGHGYNLQREHVKPKIGYRLKQTNATAHAMLSDYEWVKREYVDNKRLLIDIGAELGCDYSTVGTFVSDHGFDIRARGDTTHIDSSVDAVPSCNTILPEPSDTICEEYVDAFDVLFNCRTILPLVKDDASPFVIELPNEEEVVLISVDVLTPQDLIELIDAQSKAALSQATKSTHPLYALRNEILKRTEFLNEHYAWAPLTARIQMLKQGTTTSPVCEECGNLVTLNKGDGTLTKYCSPACRKKHNNSISKEAADKLNDYAWLYDMRITKQMSKESIAELLGVSITPVGNAIKKHKITEIRYNESTPAARVKLRDKEWLHEQHVVNRKKCHEIAEEIGSSASTVSIALRELGIPTNNPNSYDRQQITQSQQELEIEEFVKSLGFDTQLGNFSILQGLGIDVVVHEKKLGIEHHGLYYHIYRPGESDFAVRKGPHYHRGKYLTAKKAGYHLIQILGNQWQNQQDIVKSVIASKLGVTTKIYARKTNLVDVPNGIKNQFLDANHLQGSDRSSVRLGLESDGVLVAIMTFNKSRYNQDYTWELTRYCCMLNHTVVGGFSKLLKAFRKSYEGSIISYSDCMWSQGGVYEKNGFTLIRENNAGYSYVTPNMLEVHHRNNYRKSVIAEEGDTRTEDEIMRDRGFHKIFDAGMGVWGLD